MNRTPRHKAPMSQAAHLAEVRARVGLPYRKPQGRHVAVSDPDDELMALIDALAGGAK